MSYQILDSHCHLFSLARENKLVIETYQALVDSLFLSEVWDIGINANDYPARRDLLGHLPWLSFAIGLHPNEAHKQVIDQDQWLAWAQERRVILIGETGLDFFRSAEHEAVQRRAFIQQIEIANLVKKPIVCHVRGAEEAFLELVSQHKPAYGGIWHCFSADYASAKQALDLGFLISFSGNITYKKTELIQETAQKLPVESLLIETDAPYLSPVPRRGRPNHSENLIYTLEKLAELRQKNPQELALALAENGQKLLGRI